MENEEKKELTDEEILEKLAKQKYKVSDKDLEDIYKDIEKNPGINVKKYELFNYVYGKIVDHIEDIKNNDDPDVDKLHAIFLANLIKETSQFHNKETKAEAIRSLILAGRVITSVANSYFRDEKRDKAISDYRRKHGLTKK